MYERLLGMGLVISHALLGLTLFYFAMWIIPGMGQGPFTHEVLETFQVQHDVMWMHEAAVSLYKINDRAKVKLVQRCVTVTTTA